MAGIEVEHSRRSHRLSLDEVPLNSFRTTRSPTRRLSHSSVINIDDDDDVTLNSQPPTNRRRIEQIEQPETIYILDNFEPDRVIERGNSSNNNNGGRTQPIVVLDSDDEQPSATSSTRVQPSRIREPDNPSFRIFSPSPQPRERSRRPPHPVNVPPTPIVARPSTFAILPPAGEVGPSRASSLFDELPQPSGSSQLSRAGGGRGIHLGGGLVSFGNRMFGRRPRYQQASNANNPRSVPASSGEAFSGFGRVIASFFANDAAQSHPAERIGWLEHRDNEEFRWGSAGMNVFALFDPDRGGGGLALGPTYHKNLTHPGRPGPGWSFDFGPDPDQIDVDNDASEIMVCARCLDPLLANADGMVGASEAEKKGRRVWGLRCGHVLDGKCITALMIPEDEQTKKTSLKGKEKETAISIEDGVPEFYGGKIPTTDIKGKSKGTAVSPNPASAPVLVTEDDTTDTSIRSRLRSRHNSTASGAAHHFPPPHPTRGTKRKRAAPPTRAPSPVHIERRHEWVCPVAKCERVHASYKVKGVWKTDEEMGAVAMYV